MRDFAEFAEPDLELPYRGKRYRVPPVSIDVGRQLILLQEHDPSVSDKPVQWLWELVLGEAYPAMVADGVSAKFLQRAGETALADFTGGRELAESTWEHGPAPKDPEPATQGRLTTEDSQPSPSTGGASKTP